MTRRMKWWIVGIFSVVCGLLAYIISRNAGTDNLVTISILGLISPLVYVAIVATAAAISEDLAIILGIGLVMVLIFFIGVSLLPEIHILLVYSMSLVLGYIVGGLLSGLALEIAYGSSE